jgi:hypothetical protein
MRAFWGGVKAILAPEFLGLIAGAIVILLGVGLILIGLIAALVAGLS